MNGWFTIEKIDTQTFAISEYQHYEETHCYLLCGQNKAALIDTGLGVSNIKSVVNHLTTLPVTVFTTHVHWDHIGGHKHFGRIAVHEAEKNWIDGSFPLPLEAVKAQLTKLPCAFPEDFDVDAYRLFQGTPQILLHDGDCFDLGGRTIRVLHTPGHTRGSCCYYIPDQKMAFTGDTLFCESYGRTDFPTSSSAAIQSSVRRLLKELPADIDVFPGHDSFTRIEEERKYNPLAV